MSNRPPSDAVGGAGGGAHSRDPIQVLCPYTGSNLTAGHPLHVPSSSSSGKGGAFGVRCLIPVPLINMMGGGGDDVNAIVFVGHGGAGGDSKSIAREGGGKDDHAFLLSRLSGGVSRGSGFGAGTNPRWKVRLPEPLSSTQQSMAVSPDGRFLAAGSVNGTCFLWEWTAGEDNLIKVWKAHYRPVTCLAFDANDGATLFTAGEDGVVNAWCLLDLVDEDCQSGSMGEGTGGSTGAVHPFCTWSEHHLPVTSLCILPGSGCGSTRLVSSSLDRNLIIMELGGALSTSKSSFDGGKNARTLARICLPSGLHSVISDSSSGCLYGAGNDGNIYCINLDRHAIYETDGTGAFVNVNQCNNLESSQSRRGMGARGDFESLLSGSHVIPSPSTTTTSGLSSDQSKYVSELKGHLKAVLCLALLNPADLTSFSSHGEETPLMASGSEDGTVRVWDMRSRSCVKVLRPWSHSSDGVNITPISSYVASPPVTAIIAVPKSSLTSYVGRPAMQTVREASLKSSLLRFRSFRHADINSDFAALFKPLKRFIRRTGMVSPNHHDSNTSNDLTEENSTILWPRRDESFVRFWEDSMPWDGFIPPNKKAKCL